MAKVWAEEIVVIGEEEFLDVRWDEVRIISDV